MPKSNGVGIDLGSSDLEFFTARAFNFSGGVSLAVNPSRPDAVQIQSITIKLRPFGDGQGAFPKRHFVNFSVKFSVAPVFASSLPIAKTEVVSDGVPLVAAESTVVLFIWILTVFATESVPGKNVIPISSTRCSKIICMYNTYLSSRRIVDFKSKSTIA